MSDRFKWCLCFALFLILQFVLSPISTDVAAGTPTGVAEAQFAPSEDLDLLAPALRNAPSQMPGGSRDSLSSQKADKFRKIAGAFVAPTQQSLEGLVGRSEISVLENVDGQLIRKMAENQIMAEDFASQVGEISLLESIKAGRSFNRESLATLARQEQAKAQTEQALGLMLPSVSIRVSSGAETSEPSVVIDKTTGTLIHSDTHARTDVTFSVRQPLFDLPRFLDRSRRKVIEQARGENYRASDGDAYIATVNAYLSLMSSRLQADVTRDFEKQLAELLVYIEKRTNAGAASISDMARVRARIQATLSSRLEKESAHAAAGIEFIRLTNLVPQTIRLPVLEDVGASALPATFDLAVTTALKSNPEIAALTAELEAANIDQSAADSRFLPRVDAEYTDIYSIGAGGGTTAQRDKRAMLVLNWNLFSGGGDLQYRVERTARHKELLYRLDDQRRSVVKALSVNYSALETTRERITSGYQEMESISTAAEAMSKRMLSGNQSLLDLLDVYDRFFQARSRLVSLHILEMNTVALLVRLTLGAPWKVAEDTAATAEPSQVSSL